MPYPPAPHRTTGFSALILLTFAASLVRQGKVTVEIKIDVEDHELPVLEALRR